MAPAKDLLSELLAEPTTHQSGVRKTTQARTARDMQSRIERYLARLAYEREGSDFARHTRIILAAIARGEHLR